MLTISHRRRHISTYHELHPFRILTVTLIKLHIEQECIPVGCVPSAAVAVCWGEGVFPGGVDLPPPSGLTHL